MTTMTNTSEWVIPHPLDGHWAALWDDELAFRPMAEGEGMDEAPAHPSLDGDGWYSPDDLLKGERDKLMAALNVEPPEIEIRYGAHVERYRLADNGVDVLAAEVAPEGVDWGDASLVEPQRASDERIATTIMQLAQALTVEKARNEAAKVTAMRVAWKAEDEVAGQGVGPAFAYNADDVVVEVLGEPKDGQAAARRWVTKDEARIMAEGRGLAFSEGDTGL